MYSDLSGEKLSLNINTNKKGERRRKREMKAEG